MKFVRVGAFLFLALVVLQWDANAQGVPQPVYTRLRELIGQEKYVCAEGVCDSLLSIYRRDCLLYETKVELALYRNRLPEARAFLQKRLDEGIEESYALYGLGLIKFNAQRFEEALTLFRRSMECGNVSSRCGKYLSLAMSKAYGHSEAVKTILRMCLEEQESGLNWYMLCVLHWSNGEYGDAVEAIDHALSIDELNPLYQNARTLLSMVTARNVITPNELRRLLRRYDELGEFEQEYLLLSYVLVTFERAGLESEWRRYLEVAKNEARRLGYVRWYSWSLLREGEYELLHGSPHRARIAAEGCLNSSRLIHDHELFEGAKEILFQSQMDQGDYVGAYEALDCRENEANHADRGSAIELLERARVLHELGRNRSALVLAGEVLGRLQESSRPTRERMVACCLIGSIYESMKDTSMARAHYLKACDSTGIVNSPLNWTFVEAGLRVRIDLLYGRVADAKPGLCRAITWATKNRNTKELIANRIGLAECLSAMKHFHEAEKEIREAIRLSKSAGMRPLLLHSLLDLGAISVNLGHEAISMECDSTAIALIDSMTRGFLPFECMTTLDSIKVECARRLSISYYKRRSIEDSFRWSEYVHVWQVALEKRVAELVDERVRPTKEIAATKLTLQALANYLHQVIDGRKDPTVDRTEAILGMVREERQLSRLMSASQIASCAPLSICDIRACLSPDETLVESVCESGCVLTFALSHDRTSVQRSIVTRDSVRRVVREAFPFASHDDRSVFGIDRVPTHKEQDAGIALFKMTVGVLDSSLPSQKRIIIVPDDALWGVPFEALIQPQPGENGSDTIAKYLVECAQVVRLVSASSLVRAGVTMSNRCNLAIVQGTMNLVGSVRAEGGIGGNLPTEDVAPTEHSIGLETSLIESLFAGRTEVFDCTGVTKDELCQRIALNRVVHLVGHGAVEYPSGQSQFLCSRFNGGGKSGMTGLLILDLLCATRGAGLVVFNTCESGGSTASVGPSRTIRGLYANGVECAICVLGQVNSRDATRIMAEFYDELSQGSTPPASMRSALLKEIAAGRNPSHWAQYILVGGLHWDKHAEALTGGKFLTKKMTMALCYGGVLLILAIALAASKYPSRG